MLFPTHWARRAVSLSFVAALTVIVELPANPYNWFESAASVTLVAGGARITGYAPLYATWNFDYKSMIKTDIADSVRKKTPADSLQIAPSYLEIPGISKVVIEEQLKRIDVQSIDSFVIVDTVGDFRGIGGFETIPAAVGERIGKKNSYDIRKFNNFAFLNFNSAFTAHQLDFILSYSNAGFKDEANGATGGSVRNGGFKSPDKARAWHGRDFWHHDKEEKLVYLLNVAIVDERMALKTLRDSVPQLAPIESCSTCVFYDFLKSKHHDRIDFLRVTAESVIARDWRPMVEFARKRVFNTEIREEIEALVASRRDQPMTRDGFWEAGFGIAGKIHRYFLFDSFAFNYEFDKVLAAYHIYRVIYSL